MIIKLKVAKKIIALLANFSLLLNAFLPLLLTVQPVRAQDIPLSSNIEYSQSINEFDIKVNTDKSLNYQLVYKTDNQIESVVANDVSQSPEFSRQIFAGTCSTNGVCLPHSIQQGLLKVVVPDENWIYSHSFKFNNGTFEIIKEEESPQFDLTDKENYFLENGEDKIPTPTETPQDPVQEEAVIEATIIPTPTETPQVLGTINPEGNIKTTIIPNNVTRTDLLNPTLSTDKDDYAPTEIVVITGSEFISNTEYFLVITSNDLNEIFRIFTDENGEFTYSYQLDGTYRPDYKVEVKDFTNTVIATVAFTDTLPSLQQTITGSCIEDAVGSKLQCTANDVSITNVSNIIILDDGCVSPGDTVTFSANWNVQSGANKRYDVGLYFATEGQSTARNGSCSVTTLANYPYPPWFNFDDDGCGDIDQNELLQPVIILTVPCSDPDGDNNLNLPYCTSWDNNTNGVCGGPLDALPGTGSKCNCNSGFEIGITVPYFAQIEVIKDLNPTIDPGRFNLQVDSVNQKENAGDGDSTGKVVVSAGSSNNPGGEIHTVSEIAYIGTDLNDYNSSISCVDRGQTTFGGGPDAFTVTGTSVGVLVHKDEDIVCTITNTKINNASITIIKDALPNDPQDFHFTTTGNGLSNFYLDDDSDPTPTLSNTQVFTDLAAGKYSVSETVVTGWEQSSAICDDGSLISDINLDSGENVICTFTNTKDATLTINKVVNNSNGGNAVISNFQGKIDSQNVPWGISQIVSIGTSHQASETNIAGYIASVWSGDCADNGTVTLLPGENKTCTVTNNDVAPSLTIIKTIKDDNNGNASINDFSIKINTTDLTFILSGTSPNTFISKPTVVSNTEYLLSEKDLSGYDEGDWVCTDDDSQQPINNPFTLEEGQSITCTITNDDKAPKLILDKIVKNDNGGSAKESDWTLTANGASAGILSGPGASGNTDIISGLSFKAGEYTLSESTGPFGYSPSSWTCVKNGSDPFTPTNSIIKLDSGDIATCTITNDDIAPKLTLVKTVVNNNGGDKVVSDFNLYIGSTSATSGTTYNVLANQEITVSEDSLAGYSASNWGGDCAADGTITLLPGDNKTCIITNDDIAPKLTLVKKVVNDNGGTASETDWILRARIVGSPSGFHGTSPVSSSVIANTEYFLIEDSGPSGYSASQWKCDGGNQNSDKITFQPGNDVTCTITNDDIQPTLTVNKVVVGSTEPISNFSLFVDTTQVSSGQSNGFDLGTYTVSETLNSNYNTTIDGDCDSEGQVTLDTLDESKTCTITNTKLASVQGRKYNDVNGNGDFDSGEKNNTNRLDNWTINIFDSQWNQINSMLTGDDSTPAGNVAKGQYKFIKLLPGQYFVCEINKSGWTQTEPSSQNGIPYKDLYCHSITLDPGQDLTGIQFGNFKLGSISGQKFNDFNGNGQKDLGELGLSGWTITLDKDADSSIENSTVTDSLGNYQFNDLKVGTYQIREINKSGWTQTTVNPSNINIQSDSQISEIDFGNVELSDIHGYKWNDENANRFQDIGESRLSGWKIFIDENDNQKHDSGELSTLTSSDLNELGWYWFKDVLPGEYTICEEQKSGWTQTFPFPICHNIILPYGSGLRFTENAVFAPEYNFGNQLITPTATIAKSNNVGGLNLSPGDSLQYKIKLNILNNDVINFKVVDLLSNGFKYQGGSYQVFKNNVDITSSIPEPVYSSPGTWLLGDLKLGDKLELIYTADIDNDQQAGKYTDIAWADGQAAYESKDVLATALPEGYLATNFVGTKVPVIVGNEDSVSAEVEQETIITGQVLGASTELPGTGSSTIWLFISAILAIFGITLFKSGKISTKMSKKLLSILLIPLFAFALLTNPVRANNDDIFVRLEEPESPTGEKDIELTFVALDILDRPVTVTCLKKDPDDVVFSQFGSSLVLINGGDSSSCDLSSVIFDKGTYQFYVTASANGDSTNSQTVTLEYNTERPGTPNDYRKEKVNSCDFKIHFKTADDGQTVKVEIYRSTDSNFSANNQSLVHSVNVGPNQEQDINNSVPDCSKTYYYALRAFNSAGNGSGLVGDRIHTTVIEEGTTIETTTTTETATGAIPIEGSDLPKEESDSTLEETEEDQGQILGTETIDKKSFFSQHKIISTLIIAGFLIIIIYAIIKIRQAKERKY